MCEKIEENDYREQDKLECCYNCEQVVVDEDYLCFCRSKQEQVSPIGICGLFDLSVK